MPNQSNKKRVCIIGGGISGLSAAWALARHPDRFDFVLYEKNDYLGGNAVTVEIPQDDGSKIPIDISVTAYIPTVYNHYVLLLQKYGIESLPTRFSYSVRYQDGSYAHDHESALKEELRPEIENLEGVRVLSLGKKGRWDLLPFFFRLSRAVRQARPDILHGYMGIANELCSLMARLHGGRSVWGLRQSERDPFQYGWLTRWSERAGAWVSRFADLIIANSHAGKRYYAGLGYRTDRMIVVHNGVDTVRFHPDRAAGMEMRRAWKIADDELLVGMIGRLDPQKDHPNFIRAAAAVARQRAKVRFVCVGNGGATYGKELRELSEKEGLDGRLLWTPSSNNVLGIYNALDLATLPSKNGEGFANVVGEAMSCAIPVVVTDAGDSALIVGTKEQVVSIQQPEALARAWLRMLDLPSAERARLGVAQRLRIEENFQVRHLLASTVTAMEGIIR